MKKPIIVGYDPGTTAALAIIDTKRKILLIKSKRTFKKSDVVENITSIGKPIIVAGDRNPLPKSVEKIASALNCRSYFPPTSLSTFEKWKLVGEFSEEINNDHEKDALASALKAQENFSKLFVKTQKTLSSLSFTSLYGDVLDILINGDAENLTEAIEIVINKMRKKEKSKRVKKKAIQLSDKNLERRIDRLQGELKRRESDILILKKHNEKLKKGLKKIKDKLAIYEKKRTKKDYIDTEKMMKNLGRIKSEIKHKNNLIKKLKDLRNLELRGYLPMIELEEIKTDFVDRMNKEIDIENRIIFTKHSRNAQLLNDYNIKVLVTKEVPKKQVLEKTDFPLICEKDISVQIINGIPVLDSKEFEKKINKAKKKGFIQWLEGHKKRKL